MNLLYVLEENFKIYDLNRELSGTTGMWCCNDY